MKDKARHVSTQPEYFKFKSQNLKVTTASSTESRRIVYLQEHFEWREKLPIDHHYKSNISRYPSTTFPYLTLNVLTPYFPTAVLCLTV